MPVAILYVYVPVWDLVEPVQLSPQVTDRYIWKWMPSGNYSASYAYRAFFFGMTSLFGAMFVWRASRPPKVKFFF